MNASLPKDPQKRARHFVRGRISKNITMSPYVKGTIEQIAKARRTSHSAVIEELVRAYGQKMISQAEKEMLALSDR
jgi:hypothetical protein